MDKEKFNLIHRIVIETAARLQNGRHSTADDWSDIAAELERAVDIAEAEADRLGALENR
jgi:hypothetical protein